MTIPVFCTTIAALGRHSSSVPMRRWMQIARRVNGGIAFCDKLVTKEAYRPSSRLHRRSKLRAFAPARKPQVSVRRKALEQRRRMTSLGTRRYA